MLVVNPLSTATEWYTVVYTLVFILTSIYKLKDPSENSRNRFPNQPDNVPSD